MQTDFALVASAKGKGALVISVSCLICPLLHKHHSMGPCSLDPAGVVVSAIDPVIALVPLSPLIPTVWFQKGLLFPGSPWCRPMEWWHQVRMLPPRISVHPAFTLSSPWSSFQHLGPKDAFAYNLLHYHGIQETFL